MESTRRLLSRRPLGRVEGPRVGGGFSARWGPTQGGKLSHHRWDEGLFNKPDYADIENWKGRMTKMQSEAPLQYSKWGHRLNPKGDFDVAI